VVSFSKQSGAPNLPHRLAAGQRLLRLVREEQLPEQAAELLRLFGREAVEQPALERACASAVGES
jgi:hypothetical protein